tara:strand:- start:495 stop:923 length:429 start_codon:yes stop_codon:yes gene_type:complete
LSIKPVFESQSTFAEQAGELMPICVLALDRDGCVLYGNHRAAEFLGYNRDTLVGMRISQLDTSTDMPREVYFDRIRSRESPRAQGLKRHDRIVSIHRAGPDTALATVECAIPPRYFVDYLTLMRDAEGWRIISKSFHVNVHE